MRVAIQRREIFASRCRLCAVPAALFLPRSHPADRPDRKIPSAEGLGRHADETAVDELVPGGRVRATLPGERQAPEEVAVAVHRRRGGRGGVARRSLCVASMERIDVTLRERLDRRLRPTFLNGLVAGSGWGSANPCSSALCLRRAWSSSEFIRETVPSRKFVRVSPVRISPTSGQLSRNSN